MSRATPALFTILFPLCLTLSGCASNPMAKHLLLYQSEEKLGKIFIIFATLAILIACLGLFGLSAFAAEQRTKEIGIRKVLGATAPNIVYLLSKEFVILVVAADDGDRQGQACRWRCGGHGLTWSMPRPVPSIRGLGPTLPDPAATLCT